MLAVGVFIERLFDDRVQVAWGVHVYLEQSAVLGGVLVLTGSYALASEVHGLLVG